MCIRVYVYICVMYEKNMCMYGHRPHMDLPQGPLRDIAIIMLDMQTYTYVKNYANTMENKQYVYQNIITIICKLN